MRKNTLKSYEYIEKIIPKESDLMFEARKASESLGLDSISISATEAQLTQSSENFRAPFSLSN